MNLSTTAKNDLLDGVTPIFNSGLLKVYTGASPGGDAAATGTLLGTLTLSATAFPSASGGVAVANSVTQDSSADATGTAGYIRALKSDGTTVIGDLTVGLTGSGAEAEFDNLSITALGSISSVTLNLTA